MHHHQLQSSGNLPTCALPTVGENRVADGNIPGNTLPSSWTYLNPSGFTFASGAGK